MVRNVVNVDMDQPKYWSAKIIKGSYVVVILCDLTTNICYTYGGKMCNICKNLKRCSSAEELYDVFMRKIGKMCKKRSDPNGHYFSNVDGFVNEYIPPYVFKLVQKIYMKK